MSDDNGFVERPTRLASLRTSHTRMLMETAENGKAIPWPRQSLGSSVLLMLLRCGLKGHTQKQPDGTYLAWCERIEAKP